MLRSEHEMIVDRVFEQFHLAAQLHDLREGRIPIYLVGGAVRDALLASPVEPSDIDLMTSVDLAFVRHIFRPLKLPTINRHGNLRYHLDDGRHLDVIHTQNFYGYQDSVLKSLRYFDASVNALAMSLTWDSEGLLDPLGGMRDLAQGAVTLPSLRWQPGNAFEDVHVLIRVLRLATRSGLIIRNPELAVPHRALFDVVDWRDLERLNQIDREGAEEMYTSIFERHALSMST